MQAAAPARRSSTLLALCLGLVSLFSALPASAALPTAVDGRPVPSLAPMLKQVTPAVVNISSKTLVRERNPFFNDPVLRQFFGSPPPRERVEQSLGSGVIVDAAKGYVLTNNHVIAGADDITVTLKDGRDFKAKLVGADPDTDIAVLKIPADQLQELPLADSSKTQVGDFVVAVGDPFGLGQTVTSGIVSALGRSGLGDTYQNFIQTDASINPGNSGGPLVNLNGELIGINSMIYSPSGASAGIGFAIPANLAHEVMEQLLKYGKVRRGSLGLSVQAVNDRMADAMHLDRAQGAVVTRVQPGSPADKAGVQVGDVLTAINGRPVRGPHDLDNSEGLLPVGSKVDLTLLRDGRTLQVHSRIEPEQVAHADGADVDPRLSGARLSGLTRSQRHQGLYGARVDSLTPGSRAAQSGLQKGDVIIAINRQRIATLRQMRQLLNEFHPSQLVLTVVSGNRLRFVMLR
ncbi:DegQ family serine endoprotease [Oleiagrimonas soli]|uniref:Do/DeqQ family serine protease n=1 Tax=Oleiagrimonas soli TaxID=1543381 RepID=A0A099CZ79_9GAMM|nr:DegQ family serine endoprotease [Oleiagrimonas soli]KGI78912.1 heat-shock protein [Oleiagrimonas soli]MBB6184371.1 Do/DeqQ family serine protease [Oleiagrimonas soli]